MNRGGFCKYDANSVLVKSRQNGIRSQFNVLEKRLDALQKIRTECFIVQFMSAAVVELKDNACFSCTEEHVYDLFDAPAEISDGVFIAGHNLDGSIRYGQCPFSAINLTDPMEHVKVSGDTEAEPAHRIA